jgi:predicted nucleotidyltransferase
MLLDEVKEKAVPILKKAGMTRAGVFGSVARGDATDTSDVDFLYEVGRRPFSLFDLSDLRDELQAALGRDVDLVSYKYIRPRLREYILKDHVQIL